jgi:hypothetical protein
MSHERPMRTRWRSLIVAVALTGVFFGLAASLVRFGSCGPTNDASAWFLFIALPGVWVAATPWGESHPAFSWGVIVLWIFSLSWLLSYLGFVVGRRIKNR